jgi:hypothetical protein
MRAIPIVAVRPGSAPMTIPRRVDQAIWKSARGVINPAMALRKLAKLSMSPVILYSKHQGSATRNKRWKITVMATDERMAMRAADMRHFLRRAAFIPRSHSKRIMNKNMKRPVANP